MNIIKDMNPKIKKRGVEGGGKEGVPKVVQLQTQLFTPLQVIQKTFIRFFPFITGGKTSRHYAKRRKLGRL
jgi:hypothetical protein